MRPTIIICLGATAAQALLGKNFRVTQQRGQMIPSKLARFITATVHPSSILRAPDDETRHHEFELLVADLRSIAAALKGRKVA